MYVKKKLISLLLALGLLGSTQTAFAAEAAPEAEPLPAWSYGMLADGYSLGLFGDEIYTQHSQTVTTEQLDAMTQQTAHSASFPSLSLPPGVFRFIFLLHKSKPFHHFHPDRKTLPHNRTHLSPWRRSPCPL